MPALAAKKGRKTAVVRRGRVSSMFGGKKIRKVTRGNPFKEGSLIADAYSIMRTGMSYEKYLAEGGRRIDLADAINQGHVVME